jgi:hypothetical protein
LSNEAQQFPDFRVAEGVLARTVGETLVLFHPETERLVTLNRTGTRIWECLSEGDDPEKIIARMLVEYEGAENLIRAQIADFLSHLEGEKLISRSA